MDNRSNLAIFSSQNKLMRVTRRAPCPICGAKKYCSFAEDGSIAICMKVAAGAIKETKNGGHLHVLRERATPLRLPAPPSSPTPAASPLASIERRHAVYIAFLDALPLRERHADNLEARGLSDTEIARKMYASVPDPIRAAAVCADLASRYGLTGVPGFYREGDNWRLSVWDSGFFVPIRDVQDRIQALQVRFDHGEPRYKWFSSKDRPGGASSGSPVHIARPWRCESTGEVIITEGALKGDIIAAQLDCCVIAVAGVAAFKDDFGRWLRAQLPSLRSAIIAYDRDWHEKPDVERAMIRLMASIERAELNGSLLDWAGAKGLDDLLAEEVGECKA